MLRALVKIVVLTFIASGLYSPSFASGLSQEPPPAEKPAAKQADTKPKPSFTLRVREEQVISISLRAENAKLTEIAAELSRKLKVPVALSSVMEKQTATTNFADLLLEPAMQLLAPVVYIDYQIDSAPGSQPRPVGIFLQAHNETPPATNAVVRSKSQAFVIAGNTEGDTEDDEIQISYRNGNLTLKAKDQPLLDVLSTIADETGVLLEANQENTETVSVNLKDVPLSEAILQVSPHLRLYLRADLFRNQRTPLLIVLVEAEKKS